MKKMFIHYDAEGDFLEVRIGEPKPSYYEDLGEDTFQRKDLETDKITGFAFFNVEKRKERSAQDIEIDISAIAFS